MSDTTTTPNVISSNVITDVWVRDVTQRVSSMEAKVSSLESTVTAQRIEITQLNHCNQQLFQQVSSLSRRLFDAENGILDSIPYGGNRGQVSDNIETFHCFICTCYDITGNKLKHIKVCFCSCFIFVVCFFGLMHL